jgi:cytochrome c oxidase subunit 2
MSIALRLSWRSKFGPPARAIPCKMLPCLAPGFGSRNDADARKRFDTDGDTLRAGDFNPRCPRRCVLCFGKIRRPGADHWRRTLWVAGALFVLTQLALAFAVMQFRDKGRPARFLSGNNTLEILCTLAALGLFLGLGTMGHQAWAGVRYTNPDARSLQVEVTGMQFQFQFRYPGPDGKFGKLDPSQISADSGNSIGIDATDPAGKDDIVTSTLAVPINRPVELLIRSQDVIHDFFVRELRLQQDAVPGLIVPVHFTADQIGRYDIVCTQLCGLGHQKMHAFLEVMSQGDFDNFLKQQAAQ